MLRFFDYNGKDNVMNSEFGSALDEYFCVVVFFRPVSG